MAAPSILYRRRSLANHRIDNLTQVLDSERPPVALREFLMFASKPLIRDAKGMKILIALVIELMMVSAWPIDAAW